MADFRDGQEDESGTIRRDPARLRGRRYDSRAGEEAWRASANGAAGDGQRDTAGAEEAQPEAAEAGTAQGGYRPDAGERPARAAQAAAHGTPDLDATVQGASQPPDRRTHGASVRSATETGARTGSPGSVR